MSLTPLSSNWFDSYSAQDDVPIVPVSQKSRHSLLPTLPAASSPPHNRWALVPKLAPLLLNKTTTGGTIDTHSRKNNHATLVFFYTCQICQQLVDRWLIAPTPGFSVNHQGGVH